MAKKNDLLAKLEENFLVFEKEKGPEHACNNLLKESSRRDVCRMLYGLGYDSVNIADITKISEREVFGYVAHIRQGTYKSEKRRTEDEKSAIARDIKYMINEGKVGEIIEKKGKLKINPISNILAEKYRKEDKYRGIRPIDVSGVMAGYVRENNLQEKVNSLRKQLQDELHKRKLEYQDTPDEDFSYRVIRHDKNKFMSEDGKYQIDDEESLGGLREKEDIGLIKKVIEADAQKIQGKKKYHGKKLGYTVELMESGGPLYENIKIWNPEGKKIFDFIDSTQGGKNEI